MTKDGPKHIAAENYPVRPSDINTQKYFWDALGNSALEEAARLVIGFYQTIGSWQPFTREEFLAFCYARGCDSPSAHQDPATETLAFACLLGSRGREEIGWIIEKDGRYHPTEELILRCYAASPR